MNKGLKKKGLGSWFCFAAALVALITGIVFLLTGQRLPSWVTSGTMAGVVLLVGAAASLVFFFVSVPFSALIQAVIYNIALYLVVVQLVFRLCRRHQPCHLCGRQRRSVRVLYGRHVHCLPAQRDCLLLQADENRRGKSHRKTVCCRRCGGCGRCGLRGRFLPCRAAACPRTTMRRLPPDAAQTSAEGPVMNYNDNEYVSKTLDDLVAIPQETWEAKEPNGEVAYFFEGQYTEGFSTVVDPACLDMYCYTDGSMWGSFSGPSTSVGGDSISHVYGYWYNYDENGDKNFVIHLLGNQGRRRHCATHRCGMAAPMRISSSLTPTTAHTAWKPA